MRALLERHPARDRFHLLGPRDDVPRLLAALDILASSSYSEGFPNVIVEAMACGVPCAVSDVGDSRALVGDTGAVVPPGDAPALAEALGRLLDAGAGGRAALGAAARQRVEETYSLPRVAGRYESLYSCLRDN